MSVGSDLDRILDDLERRVSALEGGDPAPPPDPGDVLPVSEQRAVDRIRSGKMIQIVPRVNGWRVDYRTKSNEAVKGNVMLTIESALADLEPLPGHLNVPDKGNQISLDEQVSINDLSKLSKQGKACSVRWEENGTHADTNWAGKHHWNGQRGLITDPVAWLVSVW